MFRQLRPWLCIVTSSALPEDFLRSPTRRMALEIALTPGCLNPDNVHTFLTSYGRTTGTDPKTGLPTFTARHDLYAISYVVMDCVKETQDLHVVATVLLCYVGMRCTMKDDPDILSHLLKHILRVLQKISAEEDHVSRHRMADKDWFCEVCRWINFGKAVRCRCGAQRPTDGGLPALRTARQWKCSCGHSNYSTRVLCQRCQKPHGDDCTFTEEHMCPTCGAVNFAHAKVCWRCKHIPPSPAAGDTPPPHVSSQYHKALRTVLFCLQKAHVGWAHSSSRSLVSEISEAIQLAMPVPPEELKKVGEALKAPVPENEKNVNDKVIDLHDEKRKNSGKHWSNHVKGSTDGANAWWLK